MSPLEAAIVTLTINGRKTYGEIVDAVLVQAAGSKACQIDATRDVLATITRVSLRVYEAVVPSSK
jgi:hypothetical protein